MSGTVLPTAIFERSYRESLINSGRASLETHAEAARGSGFPPAKASRPTFLHGFLLPFSLVFATLRHPTLGHAYLKLICVRALAVGVAAALAFHLSDGPERGRGGPRVTITRAPPATPGAAPSSAPVRVHTHEPGIDIDIDETTGEHRVNILGADIPVMASPATPSKAGPADVKHEAKEAARELKRAARAAKGAAHAVKGTAHAVKAGLGADGEDGDVGDATSTSTESPGWLGSAIEGSRVGQYLATKWTWILWFVGVFSMVEGVVVFFSRRYDDWISFHASSIARIRPEELAPKPAEVTFEVRWLVKKLKRRIRGYIVFGAGIPFLALFQLVPVVGKTLFAIGLTVWGWYWLAIFTTAKSAHAWTDEHTAPSPYLIRELRDRPAAIKLLGPLRLYARLWARFTRSMNAPASTFERSPAPFMGLALARMILSLPGIYLLARPLISVAAGRLCAESDPADRFSASSS